MATYRRGKFEHFGWCIDRCESGAEQAFLSALLFNDEFRLEPVTSGEGIAIAPAFKFVLHQQKVLGEYRVDFALTHAELPELLAIEIDGHDFHERTKEQAARDRLRDRVLLRRGWATIRFTGSEVAWSALGCAREAYLIFTAMLSNRARPGLAKGAPLPAAPPQPWDVSFDDLDEEAGRADNLILPATGTR